MLVWLLLYRPGPSAQWTVLQTYPTRGALLADGPTRLAGTTAGEAAAAQITDAYAITAQVTFTAEPL